MPDAEFIESLIVQRDNLEKLKDTLGQFDRLVEESRALNEASTHLEDQLKAAKVCLTQNTIVREFQSGLLRDLMEAFKNFSEKGDFDGLTNAFDATLRHLGQDDE